MISEEIDLGDYLKALKRDHGAQIGEATTILRYDEAYDCIELQACPLPVLVLNASRYIGWTINFDPEREQLRLTCYGDSYSLDPSTIRFSFSPFFERKYAHLYGDQNDEQLAG
jgi:hypothetical protein